MDRSTRGHERSLAAKASPGVHKSDAPTAPQRWEEGGRKREQDKEREWQGGSRSSQMWTVETSELMMSSPEYGTWLPDVQEDAELEEASLRVLWQSGDLTATPSGLSVQRDISQLNARRRKLSKQRENEEQEGVRFLSGREETDYESSLDELDLPQSSVTYPSNHLINQLTVSPAELEIAEQPNSEDRFQELLNDLQRENDNLRTLCVTLTREKAHLARTVLEMRKKVQSSSQEELTLKLQLDAIREDRRSGAQMGQDLQNLQDMSMEERAQIAEQEAALAKAQLFALREKFYRIERDNQVMADEIHRFREEIGRLRQCPSQKPRCQSRSQAMLMGAIFMFSLLCYWYLTKDNML